MSLKKYQKICHEQNLKLSNSLLSFQTFGNISVRVDKNTFIIKPSGANLKMINYYDYPAINISNSGKINSTILKPSVDTEFHLEIYKKFTEIKSICHCHSKYATIWAQSLKKIPNLGTTHSDYWNGDIQITRKLRTKEIKKNYEKNIGMTIIEKLKKNYSRGLLIANHGSISFGTSRDEAFLNAERLEFIAELAYKTLTISKKIRISNTLKQIHFMRKNGEKKYYGQNSNFSKLYY